jgi:hypothetical protein
MARSPDYIDEVAGKFFKSAGLHKTSQTPHSAVPYARYIFSVFSMVREHGTSDNQQYIKRDTNPFRRNL